MCKAHPYGFSPVIKPYQGPSILRCAWFLTSESLRK